MARAALLLLLVLFFSFVLSNDTFYLVENLTRDKLSVIHAAENAQFRLMEHLGQDQFLVQSETHPKVLFPELLFDSPCTPMSAVSEKKRPARFSGLLGPPTAASSILEGENTRKRPFLYENLKKVDSIRIILYEKPSPQELKLWQIRLGGEPLETTGDGFIWNCKKGGFSRAKLDFLGSRRQVRWVEPWQPPRKKEAYANWILQSNDESCIVTPDHLALGCTPLWDEGITGRGELIGMGDGGMQNRFCLLADIDCSASTLASPPTCGGNYVSPPCSSCVGYCTNTLNVSCVPADLGHSVVRSIRPFGDYMDADGHGSATTSIAVGRLPIATLEANQSITHLFRGTAFEARVVFTDIDSGSPTTYDVPIPLDNNYFTWFYNNGARINSDSWGSDSDGVYASSAQEIDRFVWYHRDFLPVFAAGNEGQTNGVGSITRQAASKNCLAVGATMNSLSATTRFASFSSSYGVGTNPQVFTQDYVAPYSSIGPTVDGRIKPDVVAPGTLMTLAAATVLSGQATPDCTYPNCFEGGSGTSFAAPLVAAGVVLLRQWLRQGGWRDISMPSPRASLLKALVIHSTQETKGVNYYESGVVRTRSYVDNLSFMRPYGYRHVEGFGRANLRNYTSLHDASDRIWISELDDFYTPFIPNNGSGFTSSGQTVDYCVQVIHPGDLTDWTRTELRDVARGNPSKRSVRSAVVNPALRNMSLYATLVWTDFPGSLGSQKALVNDLELIVVDQTCKRHFPNSLVDATDHVNNVEKVSTQVRSLSDYILVRVKAQTISVPTQDYSLVVSTGEDGGMLVAYPYFGPLCGNIVTTCPEALSYTANPSTGTTSSVGYSVHSGTYLCVYTILSFIMSVLLLF